MFSDAVESNLVSPLLLEYIQMEALSDRYGWLPSQIRKESLNDMMMYSAILEGKFGNEGAMPSNNQLKRELK